MKRPDESTPRSVRPDRFGRNLRHGYTLVEILTATVLMIIIMLAVTIIFASVTDSIAQSRATLEMSQRLRATAAILKQDLENQTAIMAPPLHPRDHSGYFQYVEGPIGPVIDPANVAWNSELSMGDSSVGDIDDIIMLTVTTDGEPYVGWIKGKEETSNSAEIIWFIRGHTLYRRVLLVKPEANVREENRAGFYAFNDLSVRKTWDSQTVPAGDPSGQHRPVLTANSLADLTRPECRFAHHPDPRAWTRTWATIVPSSVGGTMLGKTDSQRYLNEGKVFPFFVRPWLGAPYAAAAGTAPKWVPGLGLPILAEMATYTTSPAYAPGIWMAGDFPPCDNRFGFNLNDPAQVQFRTFAAGTEVEPNDFFDAWTNEHPWSNVDPITGAIAEYRANTTRLGDDVILTNVISFDVKAWDPNAPILTQVTRSPSDPTVPNPLNPAVVLLPSDHGYVDQLRVLQQNIELRTFATSGYKPPTGAYVDLNYLAKVPVRTWDHDGDAATPYVPCYPDGLAWDLYGAVLPIPKFARQGHARSLAYGTQWQFAMGENPFPPNYPNTVTQPFEYFPSVYDTWSLYFEYNQHLINYVSDNPGDANRSPDMVGNEDQDAVLLPSSAAVPLYDEGSNGMDDPVRDLAGNVLDIHGLTIPSSTDPIQYQNGVDDIGERETQPPYAVPLQGIQIKIRVFEPGSRQVREVTLVQKFRTK